jgi:uncharacterized BrkB/YihY/UPF0761 family membrane protein
MLASASAIYGIIGLAGTFLFYLFLIGTGVIWAAELNAVIWQVRCERSPTTPKHERMHR